MPKILIVEDDTQLARLVRDWLLLEHHSVDLLDNGSDAINSLRTFEYELVILDISLPGASGLEILRQLRAAGKKTPVLMLTGKNTIDDKEVGLDAGADDYLTKPFNGRELTARIRALLRRPAHLVGDVVTFEDIELDRANFLVRKNGKDVPLVRKEFALLEFLMRHQNRVFATEALLNSVWPNDSEATVEALTTCVKRLRKKLDVKGQPSVIRTVHGVGYGLRPTCALDDSDK